MNRKTRALTLSAFFSALAVISLFFATLWPSGELGLAAFSSIFVAAAIIEEGLAAGVSVYICSAFLSVLLLSARAAPLFYALFFGYYPVIKSLAERFKAIPVQWLIKLIVFNAVTALMYLFIRDLFDFGEYAPGLPLICLGGSVIFAVFDYGFTKVIRLYEYRIHRKRGK